MSHKYYDSLKTAQDAYSKEFLSALNLTLEQFKVTEKDAVAEAVLRLFILGANDFNPTDKEAKALLEIYGQFKKSLSRVRLFVYGTLKRGGYRSKLLDEQKFLKEAETLPCYRLFKIMDFPGMVRDEKHGYSVKGELWEINNECLLLLDRIEGHPDLFRRGRVELKSGEFPVIAYFWQKDATHFEECGESW